MWPGYQEQHFEFVNTLLTICKQRRIKLIKVTHVYLMVVGDKPSLKPRACPIFPVFIPTHTKKASLSRSLQLTFYHFNNRPKRRITISTIPATSIQKIHFKRWLMAEVWWLMFAASLTTTESRRKWTVGQHTLCSTADRPAEEAAVRPSVTSAAQ